MVTPGPRAVPPFRADHVGSLLRPRRLLDARSRHAAGQLDDAGLRAVEDECVTEVVHQQEAIGLRSATDGEFRRTSWHMDFIYQLGGVHRTEEQLEVHFRMLAATSTSRRQDCVSTSRSRCRARCSRRRTAT
jgi:5-methyltetrahydropteroyltriglutamate--homocysteine methyltransferase